MYELDHAQMGTGTFADPLRHAAGMRQAWDDTKMRNWNSWPSFFQNTIFHGEQNPTIRELRRSSNHAERLAFAEDFKGQGNAKLKAAPAGEVGQPDLEEAITFWERAAGIFRYVECIRPDWKNDDGSYKGIEDQWLQTDATALEGDSAEAAAARALVSSCYLNIALTAHRMKQWDLAVGASSAVLDGVDPNGGASPPRVKALYRRAQAKVGRFQQVGNEDDRDAAIRDLHDAAKLAPQDREIRSLYERLQKERKAQKEQDKSNFQGLFSRGEIVKESPVPEGRPKVEEVGNWDIRDPKVQAMLDISPGPGDFT